MKPPPLVADRWAGAGVPKPGGDIPPIIWLYPPNSCIYPNNLNGCTAERKFGGKKCSILAEDLFFGLHLNSGRKSVLFAFFFWSSLNFHT